MTGPSHCFSFPSLKHWKQLFSQISGCMLTRSSEHLLYKHRPCLNSSTMCVPTLKAICCRGFLLLSRNENTVRWFGRYCSLTEYLQNNALECRLSQYATKPNIPKDVTCVWQNIHIKICIRRSHKFVCRNRCGCSVCCKCWNNCRSLRGFGCQYDDDDDDDDDGDDGGGGGGDDDHDDWYWWWLIMTEDDWWWLMLVHDESWWFMMVDVDWTWLMMKKKKMMTMMTMTMLMLRFRMSKRMLRMRMGMMMTMVCCVCRRCPSFRTFQYLHRHRSRRVNVMPSNCAYKQLTTQKSSQAVILNFDSEPAQERRMLHVLVGSYRLDFFRMAPVSIMRTQKTGLQGRL